MLSRHCVGTCQGRMSLHTTPQRAFTHIHLEPLKKRREKRSNFEEKNMQTGNDLSNLLHNTHMQGLTAFTTDIIAEMYVFLFFLNQLLENDRS